MKKIILITIISFLVLAFGVYYADEPKEINNSEVISHKNTTFVLY